MAVGRAESRLKLQALNTYRGSIATRGSVGWNRQQPFENGSFVERIDVQIMRDRAQRAYANNPVAKSILNTEVTNVVADGYKVQSKAINTNDEKDNPSLQTKAFRAEAEDRWENWLETADIRGMMNASEMMRRPYRSGRRDGDGGILLTDVNGRSALQHIPAAKIVTPDNKQGLVNFVDGVEVDSNLTPVAFHILDLDEYGKRTFTSVPADNFVFLCPELDDDLAVRGPTCYSTVFENLDRLDGYVDGVAMAAQIATVFGLLIKSDTAPADFKGLKQVINGAGQLQRAVTLENGSIKLLGSKDDVVQVDAKQPMTQTPEFIRALMRLIGMPFDMPLEMIAHDMSQVNFASARIGLNGYYRSCRARIKWYKSAWSRIYRWWLSRERKRQLLRLPYAFATPFPDQFFPHEFHHRAWDYTDPVREAQSDFLMMDMKVKSPQMVGSERGVDPEEVLIEWQAWNALCRVYGLPTDVRSTLSRDVITVRSTDAASLGSEDPGSESTGGSPEAPNDGSDPGEGNDE